jgi:hypothetical protein
MAMSAKIPRQSVLFDPSRSASYVDCVAQPLPEGCGADALGLYLAIMRPAPRWLNAMLAVRDLMVRPFGLKTVGGFGGISPSHPPQPGDRVDIFTVKHSSHDELTLFIEDAHLDVFVSLIRAGRDNGESVYMVTAVNTHNLLGRAYMLFVGPFHRVLVKYLMARAGRRNFLPPQPAGDGIGYGEAR